MQIFKYPIEVLDTIEVEMPQGAHILAVQVQYGIPCIWAIVNPEQPTEVRRFRLFGTGHQVDNELTLNYIGTFQLLDGGFVGHLFELIGEVDDGIVSTRNRIREKNE